MITMNAMIIMKAIKNKNAGFSLLEVLIAVLILSFGLLGAAGLQNKTQQFSRSAYFNTQSTVFAHDIFERARANPSGLAAGYYNNPSAQEKTSCYSLTGCSTSEMAKNDMYEWSATVGKTLPGGKAVICIDSSADDGTPAEPACDGLGSVSAAKVWWSKLDGTTQRVVITSAL